MSMFNDIEYRVKDNQQKCIASVTEVTNTHSSSSWVSGVSVDLVD